MALLSALAAATGIALAMPSSTPLAEPSCQSFEPVEGALVFAVSIEVRSTEPDDDRDGIPDPRDHCPGTLLDFPIDPDGCALDEDADGVADGADRCPGTRPGALRLDEPVGPDGCSVRDGKRERIFRFATAQG